VGVPIANSTECSLFLKFQKKTWGRGGGAIVGREWLATGFPLCEPQALSRLFLDMLSERSYAQLACVSWPGSAFGLGKTPQGDRVASALTTSPSLRPALVPRPGPVRHPSFASNVTLLVVI